MAGDYNYLTEKEKEDLWRKRFDSKFHNNLSLEETGGTNNNGKDTLTQNKETLDLKTDDNFTSDFHNTFKKYSPRTTTGNISLLPNWVSLLSKHFKKVVGILNELLGENINFNLQNDIATVLCINTESMKSLLENDLTIIDHDPNEQSWLKANVQKWKTLIDALQSKYFCFIFSEKDFSKTYIGTKVADFKSIDSALSLFRGQCPTDVKISHQVMEILKYNKTFSDLKLQKNAQDETWIRNIKKCRLTELKKEIKKVTFQSYLLNENEYEFLCEKNNEVLSQVEEKFHVKGHPYHLSMTGDIPTVLQVNQLISISCVVNSEPENIPLDSLIIIDSQTPKPETDYVPIFQEEKYKILQYESCNSLRNHISVFVPEMKNKTYSWNHIFENCFKIVFTDNNVPHTIGITIPIEIAEHLMEFCQNIFSAVTKLPDNDKKPTYILLFVKTLKMMDDVVNILKIPSAETPNMEDSSRSSESDARLLDTSPAECSVDVIKGSITDMKVDIVVASTDSRLTLDGYVASDLLKKAGPELKQECERNYPQGISFPQIAMTKGYKLPCNFVFFGSIPLNDGKPNIVIFVEACLQRAALLKFSSIAFPALGTGNLGYKPNIAAEQMASAIRNFKTTTPQSSLKNITIVIYPDEKKMDDFFELKRLSTIVKVTRNFLKIGIADTSPAECSVDVIKGSITDMKVDIVVASTDSRLTLDGYVASDLLKKAGPELKQECERNYPQGISFPQIAMTKGYKLPCNFVFFGSIPLNDGKPNIVIFVEACLQRAAQLKFSSIAFPALGTGNLGYKPNIAAEQMASAIRNFKTTTPQSSLKNITIVIYPDEKKMDDFFELKRLSTIVKDSKMVPPKKPEPLLQKEQKQALKLKYQQLLWIPFINYSTRRETLDQAVMEFEKELNNVTFALSHEEAEDLYFFFDLISLVPDIVDQLCLEQENLLVQRRSSTQFEKHLNELRKHCNKCLYKIPSNVNIKQIRYFLIKINQEYTKVKCEISKDEQEVLFKTLEFERCEEAKHQLDYFLGLRKNISLSKDRFNTNKQESDDINEASAHVPSTPESERTKHPVTSHKKPEDIKNIPKRDGDKISHEHSQLPPEGLARNEAITQNTQNIQDICCFPMGDSLLVKVYQADILNVNVDGIVNAANKWLSHGGGVALAIIKAAGDVVNIEGQRKLNGGTLNDGEVLSTSAGNLRRYKNIIHAVGPMFHPSKNGDYCLNKITTAVLNSLREAVNLGLQSVALPALSSSIFGVPLDICTNAYVMGVKEFYKTKPLDCQLKEVHFVDMNPVTCKAIKDNFAKQLSEVPAVTGNNIHQTKYNSANIPSYEENEDIMTMEVTGNNIDHSKDNSANISSYGDEDTEVKAVDEKNLRCLACKKPITGVKYEKKCKHIFCFNCIAKPCIICDHSSQIILGNHPPGTMSIKENSCLFWEQKNIKYVYEIEYKIPSSYQQDKLIVGCHMLAYVPVTEEGTTILKMLQLAFERYLIFRVEKNNAEVSWADIPHKTNMYKTKEMTDCLDPNYLHQVTACLAAKRITPEDVAERNIKKHIVLY